MGPAVRDANMMVCLDVTKQGARKPRWSAPPPWPRSGGRRGWMRPTGAS